MKVFFFFRALFGSEVWSSIRAWRWWELGLALIALGLWIWRRLCWACGFGADWLGLWLKARFWRKITRRKNSTRIKKLSSEKKVSDSLRHHRFPLELLRIWVAPRELVAHRRPLGHLHKGWMQMTYLARDVKVESICVNRRREPHNWGRETLALKLQSETAPRGLCALPTGPRDNFDSWHSTFGLFGAPSFFVLPTQALLLFSRQARTSLSAAVAPKSA